MSLTPILPEEFKISPPEIPWIIKGLVAQGALTVLAGVGGLGKSSLALALAAACTKGQTNYAGFTIPKSLRMMYVDAENSQAEMHRRAHFFQVFDGFFTFDGDMAESVGALEHYAGYGSTPAFIVLDSFRALYPNVEEDQSKDVLPALRSLQHIARRSDSGILVLHHTTKGGGTFRGSGEFQNRPEITVTMKRDRHGMRFVDWEKCRMGVEPERHYLRITDQYGVMGWEKGHPPMVNKGDWDLDDL